MWLNSSETCVDAVRMASLRIHWPWSGKMSANSAIGTVPVLSFIIPALRASANNFVRNVAKTMYRVLGRHVSPHAGYSFLRTGVLGARGPGM
jgi:membrane-bound metal-dependent hydrolase YbcI (DUF457 family)